jgi:ribokinase
MPNASARLAVVGSINMDLVTRVSRLPRPGETLAGRDLRQIPGGKGANQAVAAARLGAQTTLLGRVGNDGFGPQLLSALRAAGVTTDFVQTLDSCSSGVALISVDDSGQNCITIISGANGRLLPADVEQDQDAVAKAQVLLLQLEIPLESVAAALSIARRNQVLTVLDPAPVPPGPLPDALFHVDVISPNQTEAESLTGIPVVDLDTAERAARQLLDRGAKSAVIKLGEQGALWCDRSGCGHVPAARVAVVDTTAAGDAFTAALGVALAESQTLPVAVRFGCAAGTLATMTLGAQCSMPPRAAVDALVAG